MKMNHKKIQNRKKGHFLLMSLLLCAALCRTGAFAHAEGLQTATAVMTGVLKTGGLLEAPPYAKADTTAAEQALADALEHMVTIVDISRYQIQEANLATLVGRVVNSHPEYFYVEGGYRYTYNSRGIVTTVTFSYCDSAKEQRVIYEQRVSEILAKVEKTWTPLEKIVFLNDYLNMHCAYDEGALGDAPTPAPHTYDAYGALVNGLAVCQGYSEAFLDLMKRLEIPCELVSSKKLNHAWNLVQVGGNWYYADVTWNDPIPDKKGRARHVYLLKSLSYFQEEKVGKHNASDYVFSGTQTMESASATTYDECFWNTVETPFLPYQGSWYGLGSDGKMNQYQARNDQFILQKEAVFQISAKWPVWGEKYSNWTGNYSKVFLLGDGIYYSLPQAICQYDLRTGKTSEVYAISEQEKTQGYLYAMVLQDGVVQYEIATHPQTRDGITQGSFLLHTHTYTVYETIRQADCVQTGQELARCEVCGETKNREVPALGHQLTEQAGRGADCVQDGRKTYWYCASCQNYYEDGEGKKQITEDIDSWSRIAATGHALEEHSGFAATCYEDGRQSYWSCKLCGKYYADAQGTAEITEDITGWGVIAATGQHFMVSKEGRDATCTQEGAKPYWYCRKCSHKYEDAEGTKEILDVDTWKKIPRLGHTMTGYPETAPDCLQEGSRAYYHCETCKGYYEDSEGAKQITEDIDSWRRIPAAGHDLEEHAGYLADCTQGGMKPYWTCKVCAGIYADGEGKNPVTEALETWRVIAPAGHSGGTATCSKAKVCEVCGQSYGAVDAKNHVNTEVRDVAAESCTTDGYTGDTYCVDCGEKLQSGTVIPATGHSGGTATCSKAKVCEVCGQSYGVVDAKNHGNTEMRDVAAESCTTDGYTGDTYCVDCGEKLQSGAVIPATGHSGGTATCSKAKVCEVCGQSYGAVDAKNHGNTEARDGAAESCTTDGYTGDTYCVDCGEKLQSGTVIPATGHSYATKWSYDKEQHWHGATCAHTSEKKDVGAHHFGDDNVCDTCGYERVVPHTHVGSRIDGASATCTIDGAKTYYSCACGKYFEDADCSREITEDINRWKIIPALGHMEEDVPAVPATMYEDGKTAGKKCTVCGELLGGCETICRASTVELVQTAFTYDGKRKTPKWNVKDAQGREISTAYYTITLESGRKAVGKYKATITFKEYYRGSKVCYFRICPKGTSIVKVTAGKKSLQVQVKKQTRQTTGYEIQAATDKNFKKNLKKATIKDCKKTSATFKNLKPGAKYYLRVRTYKTVKGKKYYSDWKKYTKMVTIKK